MSTNGISTKRLDIVFDQLTSVSVSVFNLNLNMGNEPSRCGSVQTPQGTSSTNAVSNVDGTILTQL